MSELQAPWEAFPDKKAVSLFWRMGAGGEFLVRWLEVIRTYSRQQLDEYLDEHSAPAAWRKVVELNLADLQSAQRSREGK